jgi:hypothetical protein
MNIKIISKFMFVVSFFIVNTHASTNKVSPGAKRVFELDGKRRELFHTKPFDKTKITSTTTDINSFIKKAKVSNQEASTEEKLKILIPVIAGEFLHKNSVFKPESSFDKVNKDDRLYRHYRVLELTHDIARNRSRDPATGDILYNELQDLSGIDKTLFNKMYSFVTDKMYNAHAAAYTVIDNDNFSNLFLIHSENNGYLAGKKEVATFNVPSAAPIPITTTESYFEKSSRQGQAKRQAERLSKLKEIRDSRKKANQSMRVAPTGNPESVDTNNSGIRRHDPLIEWSQHPLNERNTSKESYWPVEAKFGNANLLDFSGISELHEHGYYGAGAKVFEIGRANV